MKINRRSLKIFALLLAVAIILPQFAAVAGNAEYTKSSRSPFTNVTGQVSMLDIMLKNLAGSVISSGESRYEDRTVIVSLLGSSLAASSGDTSVADFYLTAEGKKQAESLRKEQDAFLASLTAEGINYTLESRYVAIDNAVAIKINTSEVKRIKGMTGVKSAVIAGRYNYPKTSTDGSAVTNVTKVYGTGVYDSSAAVSDGLDGSGTVVAILDTGLDYTHPAFAEMPSGTNPVRFTQDDIKNILGSGDLRAEQRTEGILTASDVYINAKVPFAYDYADKDPDVYPSYSVHGTHVAGIVAGHDASGYTDKDGNHIDEQFIGVAPQAQLVICKVFTDDLEADDLGGAETEDILSALEDCIILGVDVINMSLGTSCGFTTTNDGDDEGEYMSRVYNAIGEQGISLVCAASNEFSSGYGGVFGTNLSSNPDSGTVGSPSTFASALAVASISGKRSPYLIGNGSTTVFFEESSDENSNPFDFINMMLGEGVDKKEFEYVVVPGVGRASDYTAAIRQLFAEDPNRIALVKRGDNTFKEKVEVAQSMGARAIIVYNNVSGMVRMSLGDVKDPIASASIDMNAGAALVDAVLESGGRVGKITLDRSCKAGPFMSDFSSWGCTPDLRLKPEITAHGGEITSTVPGGYDEQSGTSMASPNMAGVVALIRGYVKTSNPEMTPVEVNRRVNQLLMSTSSTVYDKDGLPYSPRKQGAGLGSLDNARFTKAYLYTDIAENDYRPKYEFGDDPEKKGIYTLEFSVSNFGDAPLSFALNTVFMTETLAIDGLSVAEKAHLLTDIAPEWTVGGKKASDGDAFEVAPGKDIKLTLTLSLSEDEKKYIDTSFENGMFVEGFARLQSRTEGQCDLELPFMGFYGDWTKAPMLDYDAYELSKYEQDSSILEDEKPKASVWATQPYTVYYDDQYVLPMGSYVYLLPDGVDPVYLEMEHNSISRFNEYYGEGDDRNYLTAYKMKGLYAGLLRNARSVDCTLTNKLTGEVIKSETVYRVGKAYAGAGTARPAFVDIPLDPVEYGLVSNGEYTMSFEFFLDYGDGSCIGNTFSYDFTADYEAPMLEDIRVRFYDYKDGGKTKQKIFLDMDVFDNQYAQSAMLCYLDGDELTLATEYVTPIYRPNKNGTSTVSIEITDIYDKYKDSIYVQIDDYALNHSVYWLDLSAVTPSTCPEKFELAEGEGELELGIFDVHTVALEGIGDASLSNFRWSSDNRSVADVKNGEIVGISAGNAVIIVSNGSGMSKNIKVKVSGEDKTLPTPSVSFGPIKNGEGMLTKAAGTVEVYPGAEIKLDIVTDPWYYPINDLELMWESTNPNVALVDHNGNVTTLSEGAAVIKATVAVGGRPTAYTASVTLKVLDPFVVSNNSLTKYNGPGGRVVIPTDKNIMMIGEEAFKDNTSITEVVIPKSVTSIGRSAFEGCTSLKKVCFDSEDALPIADADINLIYQRAFASCTSLELLDLSNVKVITLGRECFYGCKGLKEIRRQDKIGTVGESCFAFCTSLKSIDLSGTHVSGRQAFAYCTALESVKNSFFSAIGEEMFLGCSSLKQINISAQTVSDGAFAACTGLRSVTFSSKEGAHFIGSYAFLGCRSLSNVKFECDIESIGTSAFSDTSLSSFDLPNGLQILGGSILSGSDVTSVTLHSGFELEKIRLDGAPFAGMNINAGSAYTVESGVVYNRSKTVLLYVLPGTTSVSIPSTVSTIYDYAFASSDVRELVIPASVTKIGAGAFMNSRLTRVTLPEGLTSIPENAFAHSLLTSVNIPASVKDIGAHAFEGTPLSNVKFEAKNMGEIGDFAFAYCDRLTDITLPEKASFGDGVFRGCVSLSEVKLPAVESMGYGCFIGCAHLTSVSFGRGSKDIGEATFTGLSGLKKVDLGGSVTEIKADTFFGCSSLETIDLGNASSVGKQAFSGCFALSEVKGLEKVKYFGDMAFYNCRSITSLNLENALKVGAGAFAVEDGEASYTNVNIPNIIEIGIMAFMGGNEEKITLPASLETLGYGAFCSSKKLVSFDVSGNKLFFAEDGVLYRNLPSGGFELCAYPSARKAEGGKYAVKEGTSCIAAYAFNRLASGAVESIVLPYSVKAIGVSAMFESGIKDITFACINAPVLYTVYREDVSSLLQNNISGNQVAINGLYYSNFDTLMARYTDIVGEHSDLVMRIPENGIGYDNYIYSSYFGKKASLGILMDDVTRAAIEAIRSLMSHTEYEKWSSLEITEENKQKVMLAADEVKEARRLYNNILSDVQRAFVPDGDLEKLLGVESIMRDLKRRFGIRILVSDIRPGGSYKNEYTEGEKFDPSGLKITIIYDDGSVEETDVSALTLKSPADGKLTRYDNFVVYEYVYGDENEFTREVNVPVTVKASGASGGSSHKGGLSAGLIGIIIILGTGLTATAGITLYKKLPRRQRRFKPAPIKARKRKDMKKRMLVKRIAGIAFAFLGAGLIVLIAAGSKQNGNDLDKIHSQIVYMANGGLFENNMAEKTIGYSAGTYPLEIGKANVTNGMASIKRQSHSFIGWFYPATDANGEPIFENGSVKLGEAFDFTKPIEAGVNITLYAGWMKDKTLPVILAGSSISDKTGKVYNDGDVLRELTAGPDGRFVKFTGSNLVSLKSGEYTFVQYYSDKACTTPVTWPIIAGEEDVAEPIYAKYIEGDWKIVSDAESARKMLQSLISGNYYVTNDIDMNGMTVSISNAPTFGATVEGNGHTISGFSVTKRGVESQGTSLFGTFKEGAALHDLTLADVEFNVMLKGDTNSVWFLFGSMPESTDIYGFGISGVMNISAPAGSLVGNIQPLEHSHWIIPTGENDAEALAGGNIKVDAECNIGDEKYIFPEEQE